MTPDQDLSARLAELLALSDSPNDPPNDAIRYDIACGDAYRSGQLITLADHERAVQAAVAKAVEAERAACAIIGRAAVNECRELEETDLRSVREHVAAAIRSRGVAG